MGEEQQNLAPDAGLALSEQPAEVAGGDSLGQPAATPEPVIEIERLGQVEKIPLSQAKEYVQKGWDYTQKTQELARERDTLKPYQELAEYVQKNPEFAQHVAGYFNQQQQADPVQAKMAMLEQQVNLMNQIMSKEKADTLISEVQNNPKYNGMFKDKQMEEVLLATHLQKGRKGDLDTTASELFNLFNKRDAKTQLEAEKKVVENLNSPTRRAPTSVGAMVPPANFNPGKASWAEVNRQALNML